MYSVKSALLTLVLKRNLVMGYHFLGPRVVSAERRSLSVTGDGSEPILSCACNFISLFYGGEEK